MTARVPAAAVGAATYLGATAFGTSWKAHFFAKNGGLRPKKTGLNRAATGEAVILD